PSTEIYTLSLHDALPIWMTAALKLKRIVDNTRNVLAIEAMAAAQAVEFLAPLKTSKRLQTTQSAIRAVSPAMDKDRVIYEDFAADRKSTRLNSSHDQISY